MTRLANGDLCSGWKEIASHLGVSTRTAQLWEKERGLPVYRTVNSDRGAVTAFVSEIDAWRLAQVDQTTSHPGTRRYWLGALSLALLLVMTCSAYFLMQRSPSPVMVSAVGQSLRAFNENRDPLWERTIPGFNSQGIGDGHPEVPATFGEWLLITNIDADPANEVVISKRTSDSQGGSDPLVALDDDGELLWETSLNYHLEAQGRKFFLFNAKPVRMLNGYLVARGEQEPYYPCQLVLLDPKTGEIVARYFHPGYLRSFRVGDINGDGTEELLFGGRNNPGEGFGRPIMGALRVPFVEGPPKKDDFFENRVQVEKYLVFQPLDFSPSRGAWNDLTLGETSSDGSLAVRLDEAASIHFNLDRTLQPRSFRPSDSFLVEHKQNQLKGLLDHEVDREELTRLSRILYLDYAPDGNRKELDELFEANAAPVHRVSDGVSASGSAD